MQSMVQQFKAARRASVPIVAIETADPAATIRSVQIALNGKADSTPILRWDITRGLQPVNACGQNVIGTISSQPEIETGNPSECLRLLNVAPEDSIVFFCNSHLFLKAESVIQGIWNLRDEFKASRATLVLLTPTMILPDELRQDVVVLTEPLPAREEIAGIVDSIAAAAGVEVGAASKSDAVDTLLGLSAFAAEQTLAMSITKAGIDRPQLWERKCSMIEQTPGLSVWRGGERFDTIGGCGNVKDFTLSVLKGQDAPRAIGFIDEIEKAMAGAQSDTSGVSQDFLRSFLTYMQDRETPGMIFIGPPGAAKSAVAKAAGNEVEIPTISLDLGAMKGSLVGESERRLRSALKVTDAISQGRILFIATCNSIGVLPPELRRRFTLGTFFFDLPSADERKAIWEIYRKRYALDDTALPNDDGWTGAEIKQCCGIAWRLKKSLKFAASFIVPVSKSAGDVIDNLRKQASGKFIDASKPGVYQFTPQAQTARRLRPVTN